MLWCNGTYTWGGIRQLRKLLTTYPYWLWVVIRIRVVFVCGQATCKGWLPRYAKTDMQLSSFFPGTENPLTAYFAFTQQPSKLDYIGSSQKQCSTIWNSIYCTNSNTAHFSSFRFIVLKFGSYAGMFLRQWLRGNFWPLYQSYDQYVLERSKCTIASKLVNVFKEGSNIRQSQ